SISEIRPRLFLGNISCIIDSKTVQENNIKAGISLISWPITSWLNPQFREQIPHHLPLLCKDNGEQDILKFMPVCCDFIHEQLRTAGGIAIHCVMGISRSASIVIAFLMRKYGQTVEEAIRVVRSKRPQIEPNQYFECQLRVWGELKYEIWQDREKTKPKAAYQQVLGRIAEAKRA
ncbi:phosphatases II, partial [Mollisia scopiformis]